MVARREMASPDTSPPPLTTSDLAADAPRIA